MDPPRHAWAAIAIIALFTVASFIISIENIITRGNNRAGVEQDAREKALARTFARQREAAAALNATLIDSGAFDGDLPLHRGRNTTMPSRQTPHTSNPQHTETGNNSQNRSRRAPLPADYVESEPQSRAIFERVGRIALSTSFGHLKIDLHFGEILQRQRQTIFRLMNIITVVFVIGIVGFGFNF